MDAEISPDNVTSTVDDYFETTRCNNSTRIDSERNGYREESKTTTPPRKRRRSCAIDSDASMMADMVARRNAMVESDEDEVGNKAVVSKKDRIESTWYWLLTPDGAFATGGNTSASCRPRKRPKAQSSTWRWLLAPDGSFETAGNTNWSVNRQTLSGIDHVVVAGESERSVLRPRIGNGLGQEAMETSDGSDSDSDFDEDDDTANVTESDDSEYISSTKGKGREPYQNRLWENKFQLLVEYKKKHKSLIVNRKSMPSLATWLDWQKYRYRIGRLSEERLDRLRSIGFDPAYDRRRERQRIHDAIWEDKFQLLVAYKNKHNTTIVPIKTPILGKWCDTIRSDYKYGKLSKERTDRLNSIDFEWCGAHGSLTVWMEMYDRLVAYKKEYDTLVVPAGSPHKRLHFWITTQRRKYKAGTLDAQRITRLESIGLRLQPLVEGRLSAKRRRKRVDSEFTEYIPDIQTSGAILV